MLFAQAQLKGKKINVSATTQITKEADNQISDFQSN
jgi:hypothetical protein